MVHICKLLSCDFLKPLNEAQAVRHNVIEICMYSFNDAENMNTSFKSAVKSPLHRWKYT